LYPVYFVKAYKQGAVIEPGSTNVNSAAFPGASMHRHAFGTSHSRNAVNQPPMLITDRSSPKLRSALRTGIIARRKQRISSRRHRRYVV
jgi:hypothetical protein